MLRINNPKII